MKEVVLVTSQKFERPNMHCIGICMKDETPSEDRIYDLKNAIINEFGDIAREVQAGTYKDSLVAFVRVPSTVTPTGFAHLKVRFGKVITRQGLARRAIALSDISRKVVH